MREPESRSATIANRLAQVEMYLAVAGGGAAVGAVGGAIARSVWTDANPALVQVMSIGAGLALGLRWCLTVGRRWAKHPWLDPPDLASPRHTNGSHSLGA